MDSLVYAYGVQPIKQDNGYSLKDIGETNNIKSSYIFISTAIFHFNNSWFLKL